MDPAQIRIERVHLGLRTIRWLAYSWWHAAVRCKIGQHRECRGFPCYCRCHQSVRHRVKLLGDEP